MLEIPLTLVVLTNGGYGGECSYVNTFKIWEEQTPQGVTIYFRGKVDEGEGDGYLGLWKSFLNDWNNGGYYNNIKYPGIAAYFRATGRIPPKLTRDYVELSLSRLKGTWKDYSDIEECSAKYIGALCKNWKNKNVNPPVVEVSDTIKTPVYVPEDTITYPVYVPGDTITYPVYVQDTIPVDTTEKDTTIKIIKQKGTEGLFLLDRMFKQDIGVFYRNDKDRYEKYWAVNPKAVLALPIGKNLRGDFGLEGIILNKDNENLVLGKTQLGLHTPYFGGGVEASSDSKEKFYIGPYGIIGVPLGKNVVIGAKGALPINANEEIVFRPETEGFLAYVNKDKLEFKITAKNAPDLLKGGDYYNTGNIDFAIYPVIFGFNAKTNKGAEIWYDEVGNAARSFEVGAYLGGKWKISDNSMFYVLGRASAKHSGQERKLSTVEGGIEAGVDVYIKRPSKKTK